MKINVNLQYFKDLDKKEVSFITSHSGRNEIFQLFKLNLEEDKDFAIYEETYRDKQYNYKTKWIQQGFDVVCIKYYGDCIVSITEYNTKHYLNLKDLLKYQDNSSKEMIIDQKEREIRSLQREIEKVKESL